MRVIIYLLGVIVLILGCKTHSQENNQLKEATHAIIDSKQATYGIGVKDLETGESFYINKKQPFVMMSVVKFPLSVYALHQVDEGKLQLNDAIYYASADLRENTYSPLKRVVTQEDTILSLHETLRYAVAKSDNNACDKLFKEVGGTKNTEQYFHELGFEGITIGTTYEDMPQNTIYANICTPETMVHLLEHFVQGDILNPESTTVLYTIMQQTETGKNRIKAGVPPEVKVAHKTGTSFTDDQGVTAALNDVGILEYPDGKKIALVIFTKDSGDSFQESEKTIREITEVVYQYFKK